jgi:hypothetical protein
MQFWIRRLMTRLVEHPIVTKVRLRSNRIFITYATGFRRSYVFGPLLRRHIYRTHIVKSDGLTKEWIKIGDQYQWQQMGRPDLASHFLITREQIAKASYIEKDVLIHELLLRILKTGLPKVYYDNQDLLDDLGAIRNQVNVYQHGVITLFPHAVPRKPKPGRPWAETYYELDNIPRDAEDPESTLAFAATIDRIMYVALLKLIRIRRVDVTIENLRKVLHDMGYGPRIYSPTTYKILLASLFKPAGKIITDLNPHLGTKAIATFLTGAAYNPVGDFNEELARDLGLEIKKPEGMHDLILLDNCFSRIDIDEAMTWRPKCREMLLYVEHDQMENARIKYKPTQIVKVLTRIAVPKNGTPNYLFVFKEDRTRKNK